MAKEVLEKENFEGGALDEEEVDFDDLTEGLSSTLED